MFFDGLSGIVRVLVVAPLAYAGLVLFVRLSGKRTLSKLSAFDLVVTVALGSMLASMVVSKDVALLEGLTAILLLVALQAIVSWLSSRSRTFQRLVKAEPRLLVRHGQLLRDSMRRERITESEVLSAVRQAGLADLGLAQAVVLETDGSMTVLHEGVSRAARSTLESVQPG